MHHELMYKHSEGALTDKQNANTLV